ncbi:NAD(P)-dependent oxidoreductase [Chryseomicrobium palamuruense]|uniref:NAD(P)-dependent oxidoreductase n=1 Tax=Chryseomicrobium palamuruense TaxID=682973 RepID=A0ABV8URV7_9BACL
MQIGFIGTGVMGKSIVRHLRNGGHNVHIYTRTKSKALDLIEEGAIWQDCPRAVADHSEVVFTMVGYPNDVEEVYLSQEGILESSAPSYFVDLTTSTPELAQRLAKVAEQKGKTCLDAPVSGGDIGAQNGVLSIMIGGDEEAVIDLMPLFQLFGKNIVYQGLPGTGQHTKMCNQIAIASTMVAVCESLTYGRRAGLDLSKVLQSITQGAAGSWSLSNLGPKMIDEDYAPGFFIKHFIKDMGIALDEASRMGIQLPGLEGAKQLYDELLEEGYGEEGTQAIVRSYKKYW